MSFAEELMAFAEKCDARTKAVFAGTVTEIQRSVVEGSELTGAPGQPVDTGNLKASWQLMFGSEMSAELVTNVEYAPHVEENVNNATFRVGGPHGVAMTIAGYQRIVEHVTNEVSKATGPVTLRYSLTPKRRA